MTSPTALYEPWARDTAGSQCHASQLSMREQTRVMCDYERSVGSHCALLDLQKI